MSVGPFADLAALQDINVQGTKNVVDAAKKCGVERLVYTSSLEVAIGKRVLDRIRHFSILNHGANRIKRIMVS